jgi:hypothetical protein
VTLSLSNIDGYLACLEWLDDNYSKIRDYADDADRAVFGAYGGIRSYEPRITARIGEPMIDFGARDHDGDEIILPDLPLHYLTDPSAEKDQEWKTRCRRAKEAREQARRMESERRTMHAENLERQRYEALKKKFG